MPGAGWGLLDHSGRPKVAYHHLRRILAPVSVWSTDEGLGGIDVHVANDTPAAVAARLRVGLYRDLEQLVDEATRDIELRPHSTYTDNVEALLGRFVDVSWSYRFGPPAVDLVVVSLERLHAGSADLMSQAFRLPVYRPVRRESAAKLGLRGRLALSEHGEPELLVETTRFAYGVRVAVPGYVAGEDAFSD